MSATPTVAEGSGAPSAWRWVPSLYYAQGLPYGIVMFISVVLYKNLGVSNTDIALMTGWLNLPWVIKPLWSPLVELLALPRRWIVWLQFLMGALLGAIAFVLPGPEAIRFSLLLFWLIAFSSATHDIAADGFYMAALPAGPRAAFVGVRSICYRLALITGQGGLVVLAGSWAESTGNFAAAWAQVFALLSVGTLALAAFHAWALPRPPAPVALEKAERPLWRDFFAVLIQFFQRPDIARVLAFLLLYRLGESQLLRLLAPFMMDAPSAGGLGLSTQQVGWIYGSLGVACSLAGGMLGGWLIAKRGLDRMIWPMVLIMHVPNLLYLVLALHRDLGVAAVATVVAVEQFGYGFGFAAYMVYMMMVAEGKHQTAHYALCTGFMAMGMMIPGMAAGWVQSQLGYPGFFTWVCVACLPSFLILPLVKIRPGYGKDEKT